VFAQKDKNKDNSRQQGPPEDNKMRHGKGARADKKLAPSSMLEHRASVLSAAFIWRQPVKAACHL
jgi:hypothetical protein